MSPSTTNVTTPDRPRCSASSHAANEHALSTGGSANQHVSGGITAKVFRMVNELAVDAIETGAERITDEAIEAWQPALGREIAFA